MALFTLVTGWKQPSVHQQMSGRTKCGVHIMGYYSAFKREEMLQYATTWMMNLENNSMLNERSQTQKYMYESACVSPPRVAKFTETKSRVVAARAWAGGAGNGEFVFSG